MHSYIRKTVLQQSASDRHAQLANIGIHYASEPHLSETILESMASDCDIRTLASLASSYPSVGRCAIAVMQMSGEPEGDPEQAADKLSNYNGAILGPRQRELIEKLQSVGYRPELYTGYRSKPYQSVLYSIRYLSGTLINADGKVTTLPPDLSDHCQVDGAIDVKNYMSFALHCMLLDGEIDCTVFQPYLFHRSIAREAWHWRTIFGQANRGRGILPAMCQPQKEAVQKAIGYFCGGKYDFAKPMHHIFVAGQSDKGASCCVGSRQETLKESLDDAFDAAGSNWDGYCISILEGTTPQLDNKVIAHDVGRFAYVLKGPTSQETYLTPQSLCIRKINTPEQIIATLCRKAEVTPQQYSNQHQYTLHKSRTLDLFLYPDDAVCVGAFGLPGPVIESSSNSSLLLVAEYLNWLSNSSEGGLPVYWSNDYGNSYIAFHMHPRYAFLLLALSRYDRMLGSHVPGVTKLLKQVFLRETFWQQLASPEADRSNAEWKYYVIFIAHAMWWLGERENAYTLVSRTINHLMDFTKCSPDEVISDDLAMFSGHLADLLSTLEFEPPLGFTGTLFSDSSLRLLQSVVVEQKQLSLAFSQILLYWHRVRKHAAAASMIREFTKHLLSDHGGQCVEEHGSFRGLESFLTALPLEAMAKCLSAGLFSSDEMRIMSERIDSGIIFLRSLQFKAGSGLYTKRPHILEGAVRYSLIDHHFRLDYGLHAVMVVAECAMMEKCK